MIVIDSNVLIDVLEAEGAWTAWSRDALATERTSRKLIINHVILAELAGHFPAEANVEELLTTMGMEMTALTSAAALRSGQAFREYRARGGERTSTLADFLIAGHASAIGARLLTRDERKIASYFPELTLITPETDHG